MRPSSFLYTHLAYLFVVLRSATSFAILELWISVKIARVFRSHILRFLSPPFVLLFSAHLFACLSQKFRTMHLRGVIFFLYLLGCGVPAQICQSIIDYGCYGGVGFAM